MKLIISGRSGSGKTPALRALEDAGFNCIDNFPLNLLASLVENTPWDGGHDEHPNIGVCIDPRNKDLAHFPTIIKSLHRTQLGCEVIFLDAQSPTLVKRFSETRRRHPLTGPNTDLLQAIEAEQTMLQTIADLADLTIDTTLLRGSSLAELITKRIVAKSAHGLSLLFRSFGFKFVVPVDADTVFDIRCLPNPHWIPELQPLTGLDSAIEKYLATDPDVSAMFDDIRGYLERWIPKFEADNRVYMTIAIGCTGGRHRSVYMAQRLGSHFHREHDNVMIRHRELGMTPTN